MNVSFTSKFKGSYVEAEPVGSLHLHFIDTGDYYTWELVKSYINGILTGQILVSQQGEVNVTNHKTQEICQLKYHKAPSYFSKETPNRVTGFIKNKHELTKYVLKGSYVEKLECFSVINPQKITSFEEVDILTLGEKQLLWKRNYRE